MTLDPSISHLPPILCICVHQAVTRVYRPIADAALGTNYHARILPRTRLCIARTTRNPNWRTTTAGLPSSRSGTAREARFLFTARLGTEGGSDCERGLIGTGDKQKTRTSLDYKSRRPRRCFLRENENPYCFTSLEFCTKRC